MASRSGASLDDVVPREDFEQSVRFVADGTMQRSLHASRIEALLRSVVRALVERGELDLDAFERNLTGAPPPRPPDASPAVAIELGKPIDKYGVTTPADLDCEALLPICGARCCMLTFALTPQDLDEGSVAWSYRQPYRIAAGPDHRCVHQDRSTGGCTVYERRPAVCRHFDCRNDPRIWQDFEQRIPAPLEAVLSPKR